MTSFQELGCNGQSGEMDICHIKRQFRTRSIEMISFDIAIKYGDMSISPLCPLRHPVPYAMSYSHTITNCEGKNLKRGYCITICLK
jgi:hypothetical protein